MDRRGSAEALRRRRTPRGRVGPPAAALPRWAGSRGRSRRPAARLPPIRRPLASGSLPSAHWSASLTPRLLDWHNGWMDSEEGSAVELRVGEEQRLTLGGFGTA